MILENKKQKNKKNYIIFLKKMLYLQMSYRFEEEDWLIYYVSNSISWHLDYYYSSNLYNLETDINYKELWNLLIKYEKIDKRYRPENVKLELIKWASIQYKGDLTPEEKENFYYEWLCLGLFGLEKCLKFLKELEKLKPNYKRGFDLDKINENIKSIRLKNKYIIDILSIISSFKNENLLTSKKMRLFMILTNFFRFMNNYYVYKKLILYKNIKKILKKVKDI